MISLSMSKGGFMMREEQLKNQLKNVLDSIANANKPYGNNPALIAVSKTKPVEDIRVIYEQGIRLFGENKVQELVDKYEQLPKDIQWHLIGHLQTNKVKYIIDKVALIHSVDSMKLAKEISRQAILKNVTAHILIEINTGDEESKFGVAFGQAKDLIYEIAKLPNIMIDGLMAVAPYVENSDENRQYFVKMRELSVDIAKENIDNVSMNVLSMGMSGDYVVAIEEGATHVRVGTNIFGERDYSISL